MCTQENRVRYDRSALGYPSDLTDDWALVERVQRAAMAEVAAFLGNGAGAPEPVA